jgi:hypothetical protein
MLAFARQTFLLVSAAVMPFWVSLLQHSAPRATEAPRHSPLPDDAAAAFWSWQVPASCCLRRYRRSQMPFVLAAKLRAVFPLLTSEHKCGFLHAWCITGNMYMQGTDCARASS